MKKEDLPDFAKPFKKSGYDVRLSGSRYQLFKITSTRVEGLKYPKLLQEYIGTIDPEKGLIKKKPRTKAEDKLVVAMVEFGLSNFLLRHFKRNLMRSALNLSAPLLYLAIVYYLYGFIEERFIRLTYIQKFLTDEQPTLDPNALECIKHLAGKIGELMAGLIADPADRAYLEQRLRDIKVAKDAKAPTVIYPADIVEILKKYEAK